MMMRLAEGCPRLSLHQPQTSVKGDLAMRPTESDHIVRLCAPSRSHSLVQRIGHYVIGIVGLVLVGVVGVTAEADRRFVEAVRDQQSTTITTLFADRVDVNVPEVDGMTALHWAVHHDDAGLVERLLGAGADVRASNRYGIQPLSIASLNGNAAIVELLLRAGVDPNTAQPEGETALMTAARSGSVAVVERLIDRGADVNARESWRNQTALMWAAAEGHTEVVRVLLRHGAAVYARSTFPEGIDVRRMSRRAVRTERPEGLTALLFAVRGGHIEVVKDLLEVGGGVNDVAPSGNSVLHLAIMNAHFELASMLVERGADPNAAGRLPRALTPLHHVVQMRRPEWTLRPDPVPTGTLDSLQLIKALLAHGAYVNAPLPAPPARRRAGVDADEAIPPPGGGATPLWLAARGPDPEAMRMLVAAGADPAVTTDDGVTLLMSAAGIDYRQGPREKLEPQVLEAVRLALAWGADVDAVDAEGNTALHGAAIRGANSTVRLLLEEGAQIDARNTRGRMPLDIAEDASDARSQPETAALLRELMKEGDGAP